MSSVVWKAAWLCYQHNILFGASARLSCKNDLPEKKKGVIWNKKEHFSPLVGLGVKCYNSPAFKAAVSFMAVWRNDQCLPIS